MKITIVAGARPNFMKIAPIARAIDLAKEEGKNISYRLVYTGVENDPSLDPSLFSDLNMRTPDTYLNVNNSNSVELAAAILIAFNKELSQNPAQVVLVVDDLTPTMACAIVAKKHGAKVAHLVAGTRSFDMDMPKEVNRMITDGLADYLFTAGMGANRNLSHTGTADEKIYHVGNILIDSLRFNRNRFIEPVWFKTLGFQKNGYILLTLNRRSLLKDDRKLRPMLETMLRKASGLPVIAPVHPYVQDSIKSLNIEGSNLHIFPPQSYLLFLYLLSNSKAVITDSGNLAEETTFLGIPCITLNDYAEHAETYRIGTNELVGESPELLAKAMDSLMNGQWKTGSIPERWDGRTAERIVSILLEKDE